MKKKIAYLFLLFINIINAQSLTGIYVLQPISSVGDSKELMEYSKSSDLYLYNYSNNKSSLEKLSAGGTKIDTLKQTLKDYNFDYETIITNIKPTKLFYYKDLSQKLFERLTIANNKEIFVKDRLPSLNWTITNETKIIEGYLCTKAMANKTVVGYPLKIIAWFCDKIPVNDGPFEYIGLPGFILEYSYEGLSTTKFINLKYNPKGNIEILPLTSTAKPMNMQEFENSLR